MPPRKRGGKNASGNSGSRRISCRKGKQGSFKLVNYVQETHRKPVYCISFCQVVTDDAEPNDHEEELQQGDNNGGNRSRRRSVSRGTSMDLDDTEGDTENSTPNVAGTESASVAEEQNGRNSAVTWASRESNTEDDEIIQMESTELSRSSADSAATARTTDAYVSSAATHTSTTSSAQRNAANHDSSAPGSSNQSQPEKQDRDAATTHVDGSFANTNKMSGEIDVVSAIIEGQTVPETAKTSSTILSKDLSEHDPAHCLNREGYGERSQFEDEEYRLRQSSRLALKRKIGRIFATCGSNQLTIYENKPNGDIDPLQSYVDEDKKEEFFTCAWAPVFCLADSETPSLCDAIDDVSAPLVAVGGERGLIRIIDPAQKRVYQTLQGQGNSINHIVWHPTDRHLLLSASRDESLRLWNVENGVCIAIFAGEGGHRDEVLAADFHPLGQCFASSGMDNTVKIWALDTPEITHAIDESYKYKRNSVYPYHSLCCQFPAFSTTKVHVDYVDHVVWVGNLLLSKSTANHAVLWYPDIHEGKESATVVREYGMHDATLWFIRMSLNPSRTLLATGNGVGNVFVWEVDGETTPTPAHCLPPVQHAKGDGKGSVDSNDDEEDDDEDKSVKEPFGAVDVHYNVNPLAVLTAPNTKPSTIRHTTFSSDGKSLLYVTDDGKIWRWELCEVDPKKISTADLGS